MSAPATGGRRGGGGGGGASAALEAPYAAALAALPGAGAATLLGLLADWTPREAWVRVRSGRIRRPAPRRRQGGDQAQLGLDVDGGGEGRDPAADEDSWRHVAGRMDAPGWWARVAARGIGVTWAGQPDFPAALVDDPEPPGVLFWRGELAALDHPCVAIVGTRRATPDGRAVAFELGRDLAAAGICVVSGLALGIDGAAHAGVLRTCEEAGDGAPAGPAGVAASGVDVPYPRRHAVLWERVVGRGVLLSETLPGRAAQAWRFPARNRIIAGLARMVVVVESHQAGGSLITAEAAIARGVDVRVVPGPVHSPASTGSNQLLYDGPGPVRDARDVLDGLGIFRSSGSNPTDRTSPVATGGTAAALDTDSRRVLDAVSWRPTSLPQVVERSQVAVATASRLLDTLETSGLVSRGGDWWVRRRA